MVDETLPTGLCAVLITNNDRSMVTDLLAANAYKIDHLKTPKIWSLVEKATCFYVGGYFLTVSPPSAMLIAEHALAKGKPFTLNLSAPFIPEFFKEPLMSLLPFTDVLFGNETEAQSFAKSLGYETSDLKEIAKRVCELPKSNSKPRIVVFTQGSKETIVATGGKITSYPIIPLAKEKIIDTTGAGDAFTGGFLSQYLLNEPIEKCVAAGNYVACQVIQRDGPSYPNEPHSFKF
jgi:adenosine kinase